MQASDPLEASRTAVGTALRRVTAVLRQAGDLDRPIAGSAWTAREAAAHLVCSFGLYRELVAGAASPATTFAAISDMNAALIADVGEREPIKLARLADDEADAFLAATVGHRPDQEIHFHGGVRRDLDHLFGIALAEVILHGYDIATALGAPWSVDPEAARRILVTYSANLGLVVDAQRTTDLRAAFGLDIDGLGRFLATFEAGLFSFGLWNNEPVDTVIAADPVAFLLVFTGRLDRFAAIALGMHIGGAHPGLGLSFFDLFWMP